VCGGTDQKMALDNGYALAAQTSSVSIALAHLPASPANGMPVEFTIQINNGGTGTLTSLKVVDTLAAALAYAGENHSDPRIAGLAFSQNGQIVSWSGAGLSIGPGQSATISLVAGTSLCYAGWVSNTAWVYATTACGITQQKTLDPGFQLTTPVVTISINKTAIPANPANGGAVQYRIQVINTSAVTITDIKIVDTVPAQVTISGRDDGGLAGGQAGQVVYWNGAAIALAPAQALTVTVTGTTALCFTGNVSNTAWAYASTACGSDQKSSQASFALSAVLPVITVAAAHLPANPANGGPVLYNIAVSNVSLATLTDIRLVDTLTANVSFVSENHSDPRMAGLVFTNTAGRLAWDGALTLGPGQSATVQVFGTESLCYSGWVSNTAWAHASSACGDIQNRGLDNGYSLAAAGLAFTAGESRSLANPDNGQDFFYTIQVTNTGAATLTGVKIVDTLSAGLLYVGEDHSDPLLSGLVHSNAGQVHSWNGALSLAPSASATINIAVRTLACYAGRVSNTAWIYASSACDSGEGKAIDAAFDLVAAGPAVTVINTLTPASPANDQDFTWRIDLWNSSGSVTINNIVLVDTLPAGVSFGGVHEEPAPLGFTQVGSVLSWNATGLVFGPGTSYSTTLYLHTSACASGALSGTVWAQVSNACWPAEGSAAAGFVLAPPVPALAVSSAHLPAVPANGGPVVFTITVSNSGLATLTDLRLVDTLTVNVTYAGEDHSDPRMAGLAFVNNAGVLSWNGALALGPGQSATIQVLGTTALCYTGFVSNTAWANASSACSSAQAKGIDPGYAAAAATTSVAILKTHSPASPVNGGSVTFSILVTNTGSATITGLKVVDTLAGVLSFSAQGSLPALAYNGGVTVVAWEGALALAPAQTATLQVTATNASCYAGWISNTAWVYATSLCGNTQAKALDNGYSLSAPGPAIAVVKTQTPAAPENGGPVTYSIWVTNTGVVTLTNLLVVDTLTNIVAYSSQSSSPALAWNGNSSGIIAWSGALALAPGATATLTIAGTANLCHTGDVSNTAWAYATAACGSDQKKALTSFAMAAALPAMTVSSAHAPAAPENGGPVVYTITVNNTSLATLTDLRLVDTLNTNVAFVGESHADPRMAGLAFTNTAGVLSWNGALTLGPAQTATVQVVGTTALCFTGFVSNTAWANGTAACGSTQSRGIDGGFGLVAPSTSVAIVKTHTPASPVNGGGVSFSILVTNTGTATITNLKVVDTLFGQVTYSAQSSAPALAWNGLTTIVGWNGALTLAPWATATLTVDGVNTSCFAGWVSNTAWVYATSLCANAQAKALDSGYGLNAPAPSISVVKTQVPANPVNDGPVSYSIWVTNTGVVTLANLMVVDTLSANITYGSQSSAPAMAWNGNTSGVIAWSGAIALAPGATATVTVDGTAALCFTGNVSNTAWAYATASCGSDQKKALASFALAAALPAVSISSAHAPNTPASGAAVTYNLTVSNTSLATLTDIRLVDTLNANIAYVGEDHSDPRLAGLAFTNNAGVLSWNGALTLGPAQTATVQVFGTTAPCYTGFISNTAWVNATAVCGQAQGKGVDSGFALASSPAVLAATALSPANVAVGQVITVALTVTNTGSQDALNVTPRIAVAPGAALVTLTSGPVPAGPLNILAGGTTTFVWSYLANTSGTPVFSATAEGTTCGASPVIRWDSTPTIIQSGANLVARINSLTTGVCAGGTFDIVLSVTNTGAITANSFAISAPLVSPAGVASIASGPSPAVPLTLAGGASGIFTWTMNALVSGTADFSATVTGVDALTASALSATVSSPAVTVSTGGLLDAVLNAPTTVSTGYKFTVTMTVTNTGGATVSTVTPVLSASPASVVKISGPSPSFTNLAPGVGKAFNWTYRATAPTAVFFSSTASGITCGGTTVTATAWGGTTAVAGAALAMAISASPTTLVEGQTGLVMVTVSNTGTAGAVAVIPVLTAPGNASLVAGPNPSASVMVAGGTFTTFTYTFTGVAGNGSFTAVATGYDQNTVGGLLTTGLVASPSVRFMSGASLTVGPLTLTPALAAGGSVVTVQMQVRNTGETGASFNFRFTENPATYGTAWPASPAGAVAIAGFETLVVSWSYTPTAAACGVVSITASVTGAENGTGRILYSALPGIVTGQVYGAADTVQMTAAPSRAQVGSISEVTIRVLSACGVKVPNVPLALTVTGGGGVVTPQTANTGPTGDARVQLRLGWEPGTNKMLANVTGAGSQPGGTVYVEGVVSDKEVVHLTKNFFNPNKESLGIRMQVPAPCRVRAQVFTVSGELVRKIEDRDVTAGLRQWNWDGNNDAGETVASGVYFVHVEACGSTKNMQVILIKK